MLWFLLGELAALIDNTGAMETYGRRVLNVIPAITFTSC